MTGPRSTAELRVPHIDPSLIGPGHPYGDPGWCGCAACHQMLAVIQAVALSLVAFALLCVWADR